MRSKLDRAGAAAHWLGKPLFLAWPGLAWPGLTGNCQGDGAVIPHATVLTGLPGTPAPMLPGGAQPARAQEPRSWFKFWMGVNIPNHQTNTVPLYTAIRIAGLFSKNPRNAQPSKVRGFTRE
jgi:hypothetical protein